MRRENFVEMTVDGLTLDPITKTPIVLLEVAALATVRESTTTSCPLTHDVLARIILDLGATVERVELTDRRDCSYCARLYLRRENRRVTIEARPSDALALALRAQRPICVATTILADAGVLRQISDGEETLSDVTQDTWAKILTAMGVGDFKYKM